MAEDCAEFTGAIVRQFFAMIPWRNMQWGDRKEMVGYSFFLTLYSACNHNFLLADEVDSCRTKRHYFKNF